TVASRTGSHLEVMGSSVANRSDYIGSVGGTDNDGRIAIGLAAVPHEVTPRFLVPSISAPQGLALQAVDLVHACLRTLGIRRSSRPIGACSRARNLFMPPPTVIRSPS